MYLYEKVFDCQTLFLCAICALKKILENTGFQTAIIWHDTCLLIKGSRNIIIVSIGKGFNVSISIKNKGGILF